MSNRVFRSRYRTLSQAAAIALIAGMGAACSGDVTRFNKPFFTGSTARQQTADAGQPMPPALVGSDAVPGDAYVRPNRSYVARNDLPPVSSTDPGYPRTVSNAPAPLYDPEPSYRTPAVVAHRPAGQGVTVSLGVGETLSSLSRRYQVPLSRIASANGITDPSRVRAGQRIFIPGASDFGGSATAALDTRSFGRNSAGRPGSTAPGPSTLGTLPASTADFANADLPVRNTPRHVTTSAVTTEDFGAPIQADDIGPTASLRPMRAHTLDEDTGPAAYTPPVSAGATLAAADTTDMASPNGQQFRWPVRGRIISGFGTKPNGERNDGINLSVPEGTSIKAAEAGTVIYSGNEIAGYGNLVLIRHAGGWVSAYAHGANIMVKRGDPVRRGQIIGQVGSSGSVTAPQLHFELRRGSNPVNPLDYLAGA